jgi:hypothetical protein
MFAIASSMDCVVESPNSPTPQILKYYFLVPIPSFKPLLTIISLLQTYNKAKEHLIAHHKGMLKMIELRGGIDTSVPNSIPVFFNTPHFVIPYRIFITGAVSSISL